MSAVTIQEMILGRKTCDCDADAMLVVEREAYHRHPPPLPAAAWAEDLLSILGDAAGALVAP